VDLGDRVCFIYPQWRPINPIGFQVTFKVLGGLNTPQLPRRGSKTPLLLRCQPFMPQILQPVLTPQTDPNRVFGMAVETASSELGR